MKAMRRLSLVVSGLLAFSTYACKTAENQSGTKDLVQREGSSNVNAQAFVYYADGQNVFRASCPIGQSAVGNYRQACPAQQSLSVAQFVTNMRAGYQNVYKQPMSAAHEAILTQMIQFMATPQQTLDSSQFGPIGLQLASLFSSSMTAPAGGGGTAGGGTAGGGTGGGGTGGGGGTPVPGPSGNKVVGPVQVTIPAGQTISILNVNGLNARQLATLKIDLGQNCAFGVRAILAFNNRRQAANYDFSVGADQWVSQAPQLGVDNLQITLEGNSAACNLTVNTGTGSGGGTVATIPDGDGYYMTIFGYQRQSLIGAAFDPKNAHTFASYAQIRKSGTQFQVMREDTISWLPSENNGQVVVNTPVGGKNWLLNDSLAKGSQRGIQMLRWGPFPISKELYDKVLTRKAFVDQWANFGRSRIAANPNYYSGNAVFGNLRINENGIYYIALDPAVRAGTLGNPPRGGNNCFHAVGDVLSTTNQDWLVNGTARGWKATDQTLEYYLLTAGREFTDYPNSNLLGFVQKYNPVAQVWGVAGVPHTGALPGMPPQAGSVAAPVAALPANWGAVAAAPPVN